MKRKITWVEDSASVAKLSAGFSLFFFTYPGTIIALQMKKCRIARHNLTNICSQTLLSFCGVFAGGGIVSLLDYTQYLLNESYDSESYLSMVLCGQPKLWKKMTDVNEYHAIEDRFQIGCTLHPLNLKDTQEYIRHCLQCCGCTKNLFTEDAYQAIHHNTGGRMRRINRICTTALMYAAQNNMNTIDENTIHYIEQHEMLCMNRNETEDRTPLSE